MLDMEGKSILLIDDDPEIVEVTGRRFTTRGFQVICAESGDKGIEILKENPGKIGFIVTDYRMPGMNGLSVFRSAKEIDQNVPVSIITGWVEAGVVDALVEGIASVRAKPIIVEDVLTDMERWFNNQKGRPAHRPVHETRSQSRTKIAFHAELVDDSFKAYHGIADNVSLRGLGVKGLAQPLIINQTYWIKITLNEGTRHSLHNFVGSGHCVWQIGAADGKFDAGIIFDRDTCAEIASKNF